MLQGLVDTKKEYIEHLQDLLAVPIAEKIYSALIKIKSVLISVIFAKKRRVGIQKVKKP